MRIILTRILKIKVIFKSILRILWNKESIKIQCHTNCPKCFIENKHLIVFSIVPKSLQLKIFLLTKRSLLKTSCSPCYPLTKLRMCRDAPFSLHNMCRNWPLLPPPLLPPSQATGISSRLYGCTCLPASAPDPPRPHQSIPNTAAGVLPLRCARLCHSSAQNPSMLPILLRENHRH